MLRARTLTSRGETFARGARLRRAKAGLTGETSSYKRLIRTGAFVLVERHENLWIINYKSMKGKTMQKEIHYHC